MAGKVDDALRTDPARIENLEIDAARDGSQPVPPDPVNTGGVMGDEVRDCDHSVTPRHDGIVPPFQRGARSISIVKCRHEATPGGSSGRPRAPGRSAAARVDYVDAEPSDQMRQLRGVAAHHQRVLRGERQGQMCRTCPGNVVLQGTAARGDIRRPSRLDQRTREFDGAALGAAGNETRKDLQHCG